MFLYRFAMRYTHDVRRPILILEYSYVAIYLRCTDADVRTSATLCVTARSSAPGVHAALYGELIRCMTQHSTESEVRHKKSVSCALYAHGCVSACTLDNISRHRTLSEHTVHTSSTKVASVLRTTTYKCTASILSTPHLSALHCTSNELCFGLLFSEESLNQH